MKREVGSMEYDETAGQGARCVADVSSIAPNEKRKDTEKYNEKQLVIV